MQNLGGKQCIMGNWKIVNGTVRVLFKTRLIFPRINVPIEVKKKRGCTILANAW